MSQEATRAAGTSDYSSDLVKFIKQLASATGDLSQLTCPSFLLNGYSLLEYSLHWCDHPQVLFDISKYSDAEQMVIIAKFIIF